MEMTEHDLSFLHAACTCAPNVIIPDCGLMTVAIIYNESCPIHYPLEPVAEAK